MSEEWIPPTNINSVIDKWLRSKGEKMEDTIIKAKTKAFELYIQRGGNSTQQQQNCDLRTALEILMEDEQDKLKA